MNWWAVQRNEQNRRLGYINFQPNFRKPVARGSDFNELWVGAWVAQLYA